MGAAPPLQQQGQAAQDGKQQAHKEAQVSETEDTTPVDPDDPSQQSEERTRVEQERKLSTPEEAEGGEAGTEPADEEAPAEE